MNYSILAVETIKSVPTRSDNNCGPTKTKLNYFKVVQINLRLCCDDKRFLSLFESVVIDCLDVPPLTSLNFRISLIFFEKFNFVNDLFPYIVQEN